MLVPVFFCLSLLSLEVLDDDCMILPFCLWIVRSTCGGFTLEVEGLVKEFERLENEAPSVSDGDGDGLPPNSKQGIGAENSKRA